MTATYQNIHEDYIFLDEITRNIVLVPILLLWRDTMTKAAFSLGLAYSFKGIMAGGMVVDRQGDRVV